MLLDYLSRFLNIFRFGIVAFLVLINLTVSVIAADDEEEEDEEEDAETLEELIEDHKLIDGLFPLYRDPEDGALTMEISTDQLGKHFIYHAQTINGLTQLDETRNLGGYVDEGSLFSIRRYYDHIEFLKVNTRFYADPESPLARAAQANVPEAIVASLSILGKSKDEMRLLIDADSLFMGEAFLQVRPPLSLESVLGNEFELGSISSSKTKVKVVNNYPLNTDIVVDYVFEEDEPTGRVSDEITDPRYVTLTLQHSLVQLPESGFEPRQYDQRVGYYVARKTDITSLDPAPFRDVITRWRLEKKDPETEISDPVKPITFWIENTTPREYRAAIERGVLGWNEAFERAGFKNALEVKVQPDDAQWTAGDIRYNVIRWVASPGLDYAGYGPSLSDPRTGEIIAADIVMGYSSIAYSNWQGDLFGDGPVAKLFAPQLNTPKRTKSVGASADHMMALLENERLNNNQTRRNCSYGQAMKVNTLSGLSALKMNGGTPVQIGEFLQEVVTETVLHEVGHTLGLTHNFRGSAFQSARDIHNKEKTELEGLMASVMDYSLVNLSSDPEKQGQYFSTKPGPYDLWAVEFGYTPWSGNAKEDAAWRKQLLARSTEPGHAYANDADALFTAVNGIDPRSMDFDLSSNSIDYMVDRFELVKAYLPKLEDKVAEEGATWQSTRIGYDMLSIQKLVAARAVAAFVGGVEVEHAVVGQEGATAPFNPVDYETQKKAMVVLSKYIFAPDAFADPETLLARLQWQRRDFNFYNTTEDPKIHDRTLRIQFIVLSHLMHPVVLQRMTDTRLYGNQYSVAEMFGDLTQAIFEEDQSTAVNTVRQNIQSAYTELLWLAFIYPEYDGIARSAALEQLRQIEIYARTGKRPNAETAAHRKRLRYMVEEALYGTPSRF